MNRTQRFVCLATLLAAVFAFALPHSSSAVDDWLPISPEDLALKDNPANPGAHAMILYRKSAVSEKYVNTDGESISEYFRTKIFTKEGVEYGNVEIPFRKETTDIHDIRARTIRPDGSIVNFEGKPFEKVIEKHSGEKILAKTFSLPEVQPGCIIEYKYTIQFKPHYLHDESWTISSELFMREGHFSIYPYISDYQNFPLYWRQFGLASKTKAEKQPDGTYALVVHGIPGIAAVRRRVARSSEISRIEQRSSRAQIRHEGVSERRSKCTLVCAKRRRKVSGISLSRHVGLAR